MTDQAPKSSGIGFFAALLVVIPVSLWVGMHIPSVLIQLAAKVETLLTDWGILDDPAVRSFRTLETAQVATSRNWDLPPWGQGELSAGQRTNGGQQGPTQEGTPALTAKAHLASPEQPQVLGWAGSLIHRAANSAAGNQNRLAASDALATRPAGLGPVVGGESVRPASLTEEPRNSSASPSGVVPALVPAGGTTEPDAFSAVGWEGHWAAGPEQSGGPEAAGKVIPASWPSSLGESGLHAPDGFVRPLDHRRGQLRSPERSQSSLPLPNEGVVSGGEFSPAHPKVQELEGKLRRLGCTRYVLEEFDGPPKIFHFFAELNDDSGKPKNFEAFGPEPFGVIEEVVAKIEAFLTARRSGQ